MYETKNFRGIIHILTSPDELSLFDVQMSWGSFISFYRVVNGVYSFSASGETRLLSAVSAHIPAQEAARREGRGGFADVAVAVAVHADTDSSRG